MKINTCILTSLAFCSQLALAVDINNNVEVNNRFHVEQLVNSSKIGMEFKSKLQKRLEMGGNNTAKEIELFDVYITLDTSKMKGDHRAKVSGIQKKLLNSFSHRGKKFKGLKQYKNIPVVRAQLSIEQIEALSLNSDVELINEKQLYRKLDTDGHRLAAVDLAQNAGNKGSGVTIAFIDDGIDYAHSAFGGSNSFPNNKIVGGYDFADDDSNPGYDCNEQSHGTAVTGVAVGNGGGVTGVASDAKALMLKVQSQGAGCNPSSPNYGYLDGDTIGAIDWVVENKERFGISIISMSLGHNRTSTRGWGDASSCDSANQADFLAVEAANRAGITVLAASGNDGFCGEMSSPACLSNVVSVGAVYDADLGNMGWGVSSTSCGNIEKNSGSPTGWALFESAFTDNVTGYSNSANFLDITAPSTCAQTAKAGGGIEECFGGTSSATPFAAGVAALAIGASPTTLSPVQLKDAMVSSGDLGTDPKNGVLKPRVNAFNLVTLVGCVEGVDCPEPCVEGVDCPEPCVEGVDCPELTFTNDTDVSIRDRRTSTSSITVPVSGATNGYTIALDIKHTYIGDLRITIYAPDGSSKLLKGLSNDSSDDIHQSYNITLANSVEMSGDWRLEVFDAYRGDIGKIDSWSITFN